MKNKISGMNAIYIINISYIYVNKANIPVEGVIYCGTDKTQSAEESVLLAKQPGQEQIQNYANNKVNSTKNTDYYL